MTKILCTDAFTQRCFHKDMFLHRHLHIYMRLPRDGLTHKHLHAEVFVHRGAFTQKTFTHRRAGTSKHRCLHTAILLRNAFTRTCFYTGLLLTQSSLYTQKLLQQIYTLMQRCFDTEIYICTNMFFNTQIRYKDVFLYAYIVYTFWRDAFTHWCF